MMGLPRGILWLLGIFTIILNSDLIAAQTKRTSRITNSRSYNINTKSNGNEFDCPEEFGYYPHPNDCSQYYVCVFGGALLESCTGGLMYSHELQTCDWPRNVGCELTDINSQLSPRIQQIKTQQQQHQNHVPHRVRFGSLPLVSSTTHQPPLQPKPTIAQQYHRQTSPQSFQAQIQTLPPPPELRIAPNPVITSRGQPKPLLEAQEDIAKLYAEAHDTLPPAEEEESDRQQRVYRGQPSTVGQVQRDRDGIIHHGNINALPNHGKVGSYAYGSQLNQFRETSSHAPPPSPAANIFIQQPRPKPVAEQNIRNNNNNNNNNNNYYNVTKQNYDPTPFDTYYSIYDDDVDLYRDVEYNNQHQQQQQQHQQEQQQNRGKVQQSTYRPAEVITSSPVPIRETYVSKQQLQKQQQQPQQHQQQLQQKQQQQQPQTPKYNQPSLIYNTDYDDGLISQIEQDNNAYNQPTRAPIRTTNRNRGSSHAHFNGDAEKTSAAVTSNRGTHPPRSRPTLKPSGSIVSKAAEFIDIYKNPPVKMNPLYPQPTPDKTAAKCRKDVCLLPDCYCGGKDVPADLPVESLPQIVLLTFDDSVNDLNKQLYTDLFEKGRVNPNGCPITATFYVSHEWTDYSQVQNLYADGHEMASHTVSHSFGEQFSQKKWTREIAGQREILSAYGGVKLNDVRGMRAPFLSIGGNKMFKMLYDSNFTYDSSMPVYENRPPSWPYTLDYKIFHDCMIPPCPTKSYPGVWEVPMVMWQDLNGGRCSMGDACSNPSDSDNVFKMIMKNFDRHYTTNRAPFGLFYHAAWFTQPHHKEGFIKFLDAINAMSDVWIVTNWQALQWVRDPTPLSRINHFQPFQCDYSDRPKRCNNPKVCNLWHKSGVRYMRTCQPCPDIYPWTGKTGIRSSRVDNEIIEE